VFVTNAHDLIYLDAHRYTYLYVVENAQGQDEYVGLAWHHERLLTSWWRSLVFFIGTR